MREPQALISTEALAARLGEADLRIFDCTTYLEAPPPGVDEPYIAVPGRKTFEEAHIPGADFLDLQGEFSRNDTRLRFMMPDVAPMQSGRQAASGSKACRAGRGNPATRPVVGQFENPAC